MTCGTIASSRISAPPIRGADIRDPGRRPARRISGHISPAGAGSGRPAPRPHVGRPPPRRTTGPVAYHQKTV